MRSFNESMSMSKTIDKSGPSSSMVSKIKRLPLGPGDEMLVVEVYVRSGKAARASFARTCASGAERTAKLIYRCT